MSFFSRIEQLRSGLFQYRIPVLLGFLVATILLVYSAFHLQITAGFMKLLPLKHNYMQTYVEYQQEFGGANQIMVALTVKEGDIFTPEFFNALRDATDDIFFIPGIDRSRVFSLWTPNVRYTEIIEGGIAAGNIIPNGFMATPEGLEKVRQNILKSEYMGRLVANDFTGAIIACDLQEINPTTGEKLNLFKVSGELERVREKYQKGNIDVHIIGFAKFIGDMVKGVRSILLFFGVAFLCTLLIVYWYTQSFKYTLVLVLCALVAVIWQVGLMPVFGLGIDPMGILVPFLIFAIAVSHGMQMVRGCMSQLFKGETALDAAKISLKYLSVPSLTALITDTIGFATILLIQIRIMQEMAIAACIGVAVICVTNLILLPVLLSFISVDESYREKIRKRAKRMLPLWHQLSVVATRRFGGVIVLVAVGLFVFGWVKGQEIKIGDQEVGVPELRPNSRYNLDAKIITEKFSIGVDSIIIFAKGKPDGCIDANVMRYIDRFDWHMTAVDGVQSVESLPKLAKYLSAGWNEGNLKWRVLSNNPQVLGQACWYIPSTSGLMNKDYSVMPVRIYTRDHKAETINHIIREAEKFIAANPYKDVTLRFAGGNVGVMGATNQVVQASQIPILLYVFSAVVIFCWISFRRIRAVICILFPLGVVSLLGYALMAMLEIGLKVNTLPVVALGVGVGVDYGIYLYNRLRFMRREEDKLFRKAYEETIEVTGNAVLLTGITLGIAVSTWIFSPLKFQADMGIVLTFFFLLNMLGAIILLPALASWFVKERWVESENAKKRILVPASALDNLKEPGRQAVLKN